MTFEMQHHNHHHHQHNHHQPTMKSDNELTFVVDMTKKDLILRDHTLNLVKCISAFIKNLGGSGGTTMNNDDATTSSATETHSLHSIRNNYLNSIVDALRTFMQIVNVIMESWSLSLSLKQQVNNTILLQRQRQQQRVRDQIEELRENFNLLVIELKLDKIERVINLSLEMAKNANDLFLEIVKPTTTILSTSTATA